ncbi:MAG: response regulator transcription factor [Terriglobia bacterium]
MKENWEQPIENPTPALQAAAMVEASLLVVEDDASVSAFLKEKLELDRFAVYLSADGTNAQLTLNRCDLVVLDLNLPGADGLDVLKAIRSRNASLPILVLTARLAVEDRVKALDLGADDYLIKPFEYSELAARLRALLRRVQPRLEAIRRFEDLELNRMDRTASRAGQPIGLTPKEFALLEFFMLNPRRCLTRAMIMEQVWKLSFSTTTNVVDVYVNYLRNKVDRGFERKLIVTVRGAGYQLGP